jgi:hypothetical protein
MGTGNDHPGNAQERRMTTAPALLERAAMILRDMPQSPRIEHAAGTMALMVVRMVNGGVADVADELEMLAGLLRE